MCRPPDAAMAIPDREQRLRAGRRMCKWRLGSVQWTWKRMRFHYGFPRHRLNRAITFGGRGDTCVGETRKPVDTHQSGSAADHELQSTAGDASIIHTPSRRGGSTRRLPTCARHSCHASSTAVVSAVCFHAIVKRSRPIAHFRSSVVIKAGRRCPTWRRRNFSTKCIAHRSSLRGNGCNSESPCRSPMNSSEISACMFPKTVPLPKSDIRWRRERKAAGSPLRRSARRFCCSFRLPVSFVFWESPTIGTCPASNCLSASASRSSSGARPCSRANRVQNACMPCSEPEIDPSVARKRSLGSRDTHRIRRSRRHPRIRRLGSIGRCSRPRRRSRVCRLRLDGANAIGCRGDTCVARCALRRCVWIPNNACRLERVFTIGGRVQSTATGNACVSTTGFRAFANSKTPKKSTTWTTCR